ncbi:MAG TPA: hypothetical protein VN175_04085 [Rhizomicrobium sp.]|nr:hypothetical protein [Rhizomicrobium sp.]
MRTSFKILLAVAALSTAPLAAAAPAAAQPSHFSFRVGDVAFGYSDGYYDHDRRWHSWRNQRERNWYRVNYGNSYRGYHHRGWRYDSDRDGIPNRYDRHPNNPYRN